MLQDEKLRRSDRSPSRCILARAVDKRTPLDRPFRRAEPGLEPAFPESVSFPPRGRVEKARLKVGRDRMPPWGRREYSPDRTEQQLGFRVGSETRATATDATHR